MDQPHSAPSAESDSDSHSSYRPRSLERSHQLDVTLVSPRSTSLSPGPVSSPGTLDSFKDGYLKRYELLIEYRNLKFRGNCPSGIYVRPKVDDLNEWHCTMFLHRGNYRGATFHFSLRIPQAYPFAVPEVWFRSEVYHPCISSDGRMELPWCAPDQEVPGKIPWRPHKDFISHILHRVKSAFREAYLLSLPYPTPPDSSLPNPSALEMFHQERPKFARLAGACARMSSVPEVLYDNRGMEDWGIQFSELDQWNEVWKAMVGENSTSPVRAATTME